MPQNHFTCPYHGVILLTYKAADVDGPRWPPCCPVMVQTEQGDWPCTEDLVFTPQPGDFHLDLKTDGAVDRGFQKFSVTRQIQTKDGLRQVTEEVDSMHKLRQIEKDSEQRFRNGEGEPIRFRAYNQDSSNRDVHSFGDRGQIGEQTYDNGAAPAKKQNLGVTRHGQKKPRVATAKGGGVTALKG